MTGPGDNTASPRPWVATPASRLIPLLILTTILVLVPAVSRPSTPQREQTFLGFEAGQEVRYAFEREGAQPADRTVHWSITLLGVDESGSQGTFELSYIVVVSGQRLAQAIAEARVNVRGFPLQVRFGSERATRAGDIGYTIEYRFEEGKLRKELVGADLNDQEIELDDLAGVDTGAPRGLYLYNPLDAACARGFAEAAPIENEPTSGGPGEVIVEPLCGGRELIFANPGLLNLVIPAMWEAGTGALDFVALAPTGMRLELLTGPVNPGGGVNVGPLNLASLFSSGPDPFHDGSEALQPLALRAGSDLLQLDVGGRTEDVWRLDTPRPFADVYVDGNGSIVRLDLPEGSTEEGGAWIRRLRPSEF